MNLITIENITKSYGDKAILDNISLGINDGDKIGIIGINGTGKTTLLKIIAGVDECDEGKITTSNELKMEYLFQNPDYNPENTVLEQVFKGNSKEMMILREYENILEKVNFGDTSLSEKLIKLQEQIDSLNLWQMESEAKMILTKLGIYDFGKKMGKLSGGQRKRVFLAAALIRPSNLLILDEPTNHMDNDTIDWLEGYLNSRKGALLMITHDRYFLDRVTNRIVEVSDGVLYNYEGNYSLYVEKKLEREEQKVSEQRKKENLYRNELKWIRRGAKARSTKQKARIDRFEKLKDSMEKISDDKLELSVVGTRLGNKIIEINDISKSYEKDLIKDFTYTLLRNDRIGIIGPNGAGKSTLMDIISGKTKPDKGTVEIGDTVKIGYFSQETYDIDGSMRVIDYVKEIAEYLPLSNGDRISASDMLERFLFAPEKQYTPISKLSGGERKRLYLLNVLMSSPNVLLFDEPTNDLDIATLTVLEDFLDKFNGPVMTVSHDRYFVDRTCNKIFAYEGEGEIEIIHGNYSDYSIWKEENKRINDVPVEVKVEKKGKPSKERTLKFSYNEQKEFDEIDDVIAGLEDRVADIDKEIEKCVTDYVRLQELTDEKEEVKKQLDEKYERWTYLNELAEKIDEQKKH
ncbi:ABC-F family ATP-binding cassette domain-containing protein [Inconstantimicrobium porci]|uniref:ABC-F family ATP-binding cassette domain-containing protein n=1 Tax=Inconstantimicrobium porci TaxID=2652291 RepID=A0A7X2MX09_9CLOT|nr:ABC-F family ATP-binding cassette domain-containing protein [Inconstantimicrobium porci]MDD6772027.1 ABC-F family ATP-binding cassette domain-containing protein [Inconstantimicrobium porci]MSR90627.1 ABC-F family ATP-binding cassette domain-containing protein [Inconstantimicrobium porci]